MEISPLTQYLAAQLLEAILLIPKIASEGKKKDIHKFRVAMRCVRSLLKIYVGESAPFPPFLKQLLKQTNNLRELDVLLSTIKRTRYPKTHKKLRALRKEYFRSTFTDTLKYEAIRELEKYYQELYTLNPDAEPLQWISITEEHYQKCSHEYRTFPQSATQNELHALRIRFKTARYALEFLNESGLSDEKEKINECKLYQDTLGAIQDTYNQVSWLKNFYKQYPTPELKKLIRKHRKYLNNLKATRVSTQSAQYQTS